MIVQLPLDNFKQLHNYKHYVDLKNQKGSNDWIMWLPLGLGII